VGLLTGIGVLLSVPPLVKGGWRWSGLDSLFLGSLLLLIICVRRVKRDPNDWTADLLSIWLLVLVLGLFVVIEISFALTPQRF
jgi:hypothetical protein